MLITGNAQNTYLIYSVRRLLLKINCSNVLNTLFINKAVVNLATRALVTYTISCFILLEKLENTTLAVGNVSRFEKRTCTSEIYKRGERKCLPV